jgi:hypothetical protein
LLQIALRLRFISFENEPVLDQNTILKKKIKLIIIKKIHNTEKIDAIFSNHFPLVLKILFERKLSFL